MIVILRLKLKEDYPFSFFYRYYNNTINKKEIEKGTFMKLFNRCGYVLNFSTNDFDIFKIEGVGISLCATYKQSKGHNDYKFSLGYS